MFFETMEHFKLYAYSFWENLSSCAVIQDYTVIRDIRVLIILVSIFHLLRDKRKGRVCVLCEEREGGGRLLTQTESVYRETASRNDMSDILRNAQVKFLVTVSLFMPNLK